MAAGSVPSHVLPVPRPGRATVRVLVTGSAGLIGSEAVEYFEANAELQTIDADSNAMLDELGNRYRRALEVSRG